MLLGQGKCEKVMLKSGPYSYLASNPTLHYALGAVHILRQPILEVFRPPLPPRQQSSAMQHLADPPSINAFKENTPMK